MKRMFIIAAAVALALLPSSAFAQKTKTQLQTEITNNFPDNSQGAITPAIARQTFSDFVNSWQQYTGVNAQTGTTYTIQLSDYGQLVTFNSASPVAVTLPNPGTGFTTFNVYVRNLGLGIVTITPIGSNINSAASLSLGQNQSVQIVSDGANYQIVSGNVAGSTIPNAIYSTNSASSLALRNIITGQNYLAPMTNTGEAFGYSFRNSTVTGNAIYDSIFPGVSAQDGIQSVLSIPATATVTGGSAIAAYLDNGVTASGGGRNGVLLFGAGRCTVDGSACWGINTLLQDAAARVAGSGSGRILVSELDYNVMNPNTQIIGLSVGGNSLAQSNNAIAFIANSLGAGGPYKWQTGFDCIDGAVSANCLVAGPIDASGTSTKSTKILQQYFNGASVKKTVTIQSDTNRIAFTTDDSGMNLTLGTTGTNSGSITIAASGGNSITIQPQPATALYNFNLPVGAGTAGQPLLSGGGANTAQTYGTLGVGGGGTSITSGTSGGIPYFNSATTMASSAALASTAIVVGGGAGLSPASSGCTIAPSTNSLACISSVSFSPGFILQNTTNDAGFVGHNLYKQRAGAIVQNNDGIGGYGFYGYDGSTFQIAAQIFAQVDGAPGAGSMPGRIVFNTTPSGTVTLAEAFRIDNSQRIQFAAPSIAANGGVATAMTSLGPAGSHTTIQEWLQVKNAAGTLRYIPTF